ncbi:MAG: radical SAM protein, partial [Clostridia bacterium]|nr:radical SAM protein [Clostridia bacterium]
GAHMMTGIAGAGRGMENVEAIARFFNRTQPQHIINFSLFLHKQAPLYEDILAGRFQPADEVENLREGHRLLSLLDYECRYDGLHDFVEGRVRGTLPKDREKMLKAYETLIERYEKEEPRFAYID